MKMQVEELNGILGDDEYYQYDNEDYSEDYVKCRIRVQFCV